jgi:hypothetical protein
MIKTRKKDADQKAICESIVQQLARKRFLHTLVSSKSFCILASLSASVGS